MYEPKRDGRFEYVWEAMHYLEERQCKACVFKNTGDPDYPMCWPIANKFINEEPVEEIADLGSNGLYCNKYRNGDPTPPQAEGQETLF